MPGGVGGARASLASTRFCAGGRPATAVPTATVVRWGVVRAGDLNDLLSGQKAVVYGDGGPATGGHLHGEGSAGRDAGALR